MVPSTGLLRDTRDRLLRWGILIGCLMPVVGAYLYSWGFRLMDGTCLFQQWVGFPSPSCGMTRSFTAIARGDWLTALSYHAFGPLLFGAFLLTAIHTSFELLTGKTYKPWYQSMVQAPIVPISLSALFFAYYGLRLYARYGNADSFDLFMFHTALWHGLVAGANAL